jgi:hypothetical protein
MQILLLALYQNLIKLLQDSKQLRQELLLSLREMLFLQLQLILSLSKQSKKLLL